MSSSVRKFPLVPLAVIAVAGTLTLWFFPLFHVVPLPPPAAPSATPGRAASENSPAAAGATSADAAPAVAAFDPVSAAAKIWKNDLPAAAATHAVELAILAPALRANPEAAKKQFAHAADLGTAYYFVRGTGKVVARERNTLRIAPDGASAETVALRLGPVFGNAVRDGCGLLDVNSFPGLAEFNALSAELNALVEKNVLPPLREKAVVGAVVSFAGCAEAPESAPDAGEPLLVIVPVQAGVR